MPLERTESVWPSCAGSSAPPDPLVTDVTLEPLAFIVYAGAPDVPPMNAIFEPSGDHAGSTFDALGALFVRSVCELPSLAFIVKMSQWWKPATFTSVVKAIFPVELQSGCVSLFELVVNWVTGTPKVESV